MKLATLLLLVVLTTGASAANRSMAGRLATEAPVTQNQELVQEEAAPVEEQVDVYFDAVELEAEEVEVESEGDIESL